MNQTAARYEAEAADPERLRQQRDGLWDLARVNATEIARLQAEVEELREERAAVRRSLGDFFIPMVDEDGNESEHSYYMDQGAHIPCVELQRMEDILDRAMLPRAPSDAQVALLQSWLRCWWQQTRSAEEIHYLISEWERIRTNEIPEVER